MNTKAFENVHLNLPCVDIATFGKRPSFENRSKLKQAPLSLLGPWFLAHSRLSKPLDFLLSAQGFHQSNG